MELTQLGGVDEAKRVNEAVIGEGAVLIITERVMTEGDQMAESKNEIELAGTNSKTNIVSRSVIKGNSSQDFYVNLTAKAKCYGHIECDAIIMDNGINQTIPALRALHPDAELTHEASIGKIADDRADFYDLGSCSRGGGRFRVGRGGDFRRYGALAAC